MPGGVLRPEEQLRGRLSQQKHLAAKKTERFPGVQEQPGRNGQSRRVNAVSQLFDFV